MSHQASHTIGLELWPLKKVPDAIEEELCKILWNWEECRGCAQSLGCVKNACVWQRRKELEPFFHLYRDTAIWISPEEPSGERPALRSHQDLFEIIRLLKLNPDTIRSDLIHRHFSTYINSMPDEEDQRKAFDLALQIMTTVECNPFSLTGQPHIWKGRESLRTAMAKFFSVSGSISLHDNRIRDTLRASRLKYLYAITVEGTEYLNEHLHLDTDTMTLKVYHLTAFLKEYLRVKVTNRAESGCVSISPSLQASADELVELFHVNSYLKYWSQFRRSFSPQEMLNRGQS